MFLFLFLFLWYVAYVEFKPVADTKRDMTEYNKNNKNVIVDPNDDSWWYWTYPETINLV